MTGNFRKRKKNGHVIDNIQVPGGEEIGFGGEGREPDLLLIIKTSSVLSFQKPNFSFQQDNKNLRLINLGHNPLTDKVLEAIEPALHNNLILEALGLQSTLITDTGAQHLAQGLEDNTSLRVTSISCKSDFPTPPFPETQPEGQQGDPGGGRGGALRRAHPLQGHQGGDRRDEPHVPRTRPRRKVAR